MKKLKRIILISLIIVFSLTAIGFISYPHICKSLGDISQNKKIEEYEKTISILSDDKELVKVNTGTRNTKLNLKQLKKDVQRYNKFIFNDRQNGLTEETIKIPALNLKNYGFKDSMYGYITIDKIDVNMPIYLGCNESTMAQGAAHLSYTSIPYGGKNTNSVIAGHCGYGYNNYFRYLETLRKGDMVVITTPFSTLKYKVCERIITKPQSTEKLLLQSGKDMITLFTCYPYPSNRYRCCIFCERYN